MIRTGILSEESRVELLEGYLARKDRRDQKGSPMNVGPRHAAVVTRLIQALSPAETDHTHVRCQQPISLPPENEPEPDAAIVQGSPDDYFDQHPQASEVLLVVEVAESSLRQDRDVKQRIYAQAEIPAYWIVDISQACVEVYTDPQSDSQSHQARYTQMQTVSRAGEISLTLPDGQTLSVAVANLFPQTS